MASRPLYAPRGAECDAPRRSDAISAYMPQAEARPASRIVRARKRGVLTLFAPRSGARGFAGRCLPPPSARGNCGA